MPAGCHSCLTSAVVSTVNILQLMPQFEIWSVETSQHQQRAGAWSLGKIAKFDANVCGVAPSVGLHNHQEERCWLALLCRQSTKKSSLVCAQHKQEGSITAELAGESKVCLVPTY